MKTTKSELKEFVSFVCNGNYDLINDFELIKAKEDFLNSLNGVEPSQRALDDNKEVKEFLQNLADKQKPIPKEFAEALEKRFDDLIVKKT